MALAKFVETIFVYCVALFYGFLVSFGLLWSLIRKPSALRKLEHPMPKCLLNPDLGEHNYVRTESGLRFHYVAKGDPNNPLMLFVHGFPEFWYSWRHQLQAFAGSYRVVAIDLRGYGDSDKPEGKDMYQILLLAKDIKEIITSLGYSSCILVGHDWGGAIAWSVADQYPEHVDKLVVMNMPHPRLFAKYLRNTWSQFKKSWYVFFFQLPYLPELLLSWDDFKMFDSMLKNKKIKENPTCYHGNIEEDVEAYKHIYCQPGALTAPINYYRSNLGGLGRGSSFSTKIKAPTLIVWGTEDIALEKGALQGTDKYVEDVTIRYVDGASHFVHEDEPEVVTKMMEEFLVSHSS